MFKHILVPVDGSAHALKAVEIGADLASKYGGRLTLLHVMARAGSGRVPEELQELSRIEHIKVTEAEALQSIADEILTGARKKAGMANEIELETAVGDPASEIVAFINNHEIDLVVMGRRGLGDLAGLMLGSVSHKISHLADCPCLTVQ